MKARFSLETSEHEFFSYTGFLFWQWLHYYFSNCGRITAIGNKTLEYVKESQAQWRWQGTASSLHVFIEHPLTGSAEQFVIFLEKPGEMVSVWK